MALYTNRFSFADHSFDDTLIDLGVRFVINCPPEDISTAVRLFFQLEEAHWFYEDFAREQNQALPSLKMKNFVAQLYRAMPLMSVVCPDPDAALAEFQSYKSSIPVRGGILVNESLDKVLMVRSWKGASWGFPKGKINKEEDDAVCAVREVLEETGYDMGSLIDRNEYIESTYGGKNIRLYVVSGVPEKTHFETQTRKEISRIDWIPVSSLPVFNRRPKNTFNFYMVTPFMHRLKSYIARKKGYATKLSESESGALKNMLGISAGSTTTVQNDEATAQHLLAMLRGSQPAAAPAAAPAPAPVPAAPEVPPVSTNHDKDRDILLNLLKQGTPEPAEPAPGAAPTGDVSANKTQAEVAGTREILSLLQHEMATEKTVTAPPTIQPPQSQADASARPVEAPALPPMGLLESLVHSRKANPVRKAAVPNPNEHRSTAPTKNSLLNLLNKPKQAESAKLMALLKPVKPPQPAPRRSALMSLLDSSSSGGTADDAKSSGPIIPSSQKPQPSQSSSSSSSQSPQPSQPSSPSQALPKPVSPSAHNAPLPSTVAKPPPQRPPSSLLGLLNPDHASKSDAKPSTPIDATVPPAAVPPAPAIDVQTASCNRASASGAEPQPISTVSSAPERAADAPSLQQDPKRSGGTSLGKTAKPASRAPRNALLGLLSAEKPSDAVLAAPAAPAAPSREAVEPASQAGDSVTSRPQPSPSPAPVPAAVEPPQSSDSSTRSRPQHDAADLSALSLNAKPSLTGLQNPGDAAPDARRSKDTTATNSASSVGAAAGSPHNPLLKLLEPSSAPPAVAVPRAPASHASPDPPSAAKSRSNAESQALMSLLAKGSPSAAHAQPAAHAPGPQIGSRVEHTGAAVPAQTPVTPDENAESRSSAAALPDAPVHLLKLLSQH